MTKRHPAAQDPGGALSETDINTIMTRVMRLRQPISVTMNSGRVYDIVWNHQNIQPEVIEPGTTAITIRGVAQVFRWLEDLTTVSAWDAQTGLHEPPGSRSVRTS